LTNTDSDVINTIVGRLIGSEFAYEGSSRGLVAAGSVIGGLALATLGAIGTFGGPVLPHLGAITAGSALGSYYGGQQAAAIGDYPRISSDEYIYDMTDTTEMNDPNFTFDKLIEIFKPNLIVKRYRLPPLEYVIYVFDLVLRWSDFNAIETRFVTFGESYIDPILRSIANPPKPGMVRGVKTLRELSYDTVDGNYGGFAPKIDAETFSQATYNFRDVYDESKKIN